MEDIANSWQGISSHAKKVGARFPALVAAQWACESGFGKHLSGRNNLFGLKGRGLTVATKEFYDGQWVTINDSFINFPSRAACVEYLISRWYKDWAGHKGVNNAAGRKAAACMLESEGYATDPSYAIKLNRLMDEYAPLSPMAPILLSSAAKYYKEEPHQLAGWNWLQEELTPEQLEEFASIYRSGPPPKPSNPLKVPYFSQRDNASGQGMRECFSSSCAMVAAFYGRVSSDDKYNEIRARYGDTTDSSAQIKTLQSLGLKPIFRQNVTKQELEAEINAGRPLAVGWLHHASYKAPSGGGHWSVAVGFNSASIIHMDPNGNADIVNGGYKGATGGKYVYYANQYWLPRWSVRGIADGWALFIRP